MSFRILKISKLLKLSTQTNYEIRSWDDLGKAFDQQAQQDLFKKWKEYLDYAESEMAEAEELGEEKKFARTEDIKSFLDFYNSRGLEKNDISFQPLERELQQEVKAILSEAFRRKASTQSNSPAPPSPSNKPAENKASKGHSGAKKVWTKGDLGRYTGGGINFHLMKDGKNNYRAGLKPKYTDLSLEFFKSLKDNFGIKRIISLNGSDEWEGANLPALISEAGMQHVYIPMGTVPTRQEFDRIKGLLREGSNLVHCTHGADRTGSVVGRYYMEELGWPMEKAVEETKRYGGHKYKANIEFITEAKFKERKRKK